jgi:hypothetical protein
MTFNIVTSSIDFVYANKLCWKKKQRQLGSKQHTRRSDYFIDRFRYETKKQITPVFHIYHGLCLYVYIDVYSND